MKEKINVTRFVTYLSKKSFIHPFDYPAKHPSTYLSYIQLPLHVSTLPFPIIAYTSLSSIHPFSMQTNHPSILLPLSQFHHPPSIVGNRVTSVEASASCVEMVMRVVAREKKKKTRGSVRERTSHVPASTAAQRQKVRHWKASNKHPGSFTPSFSE